MRIVIKNADFSSVSIGKVLKDLSFSFDAGDGVDAINGFFPNYNSGGTPTATTIYLGSSGGTITTSNSSNRIVSDYHEVSQGMTVALKRIYGTATTPTIIAFDENKNIISASCAWNTGDPISYTYVVPAGVKYLKFQSQGVVTSGDNSKVVATMPE